LSFRPTALELLNLLDARGVVGKQLQANTFGVPGDGVTLVISRENLHDEGRLRKDIDQSFSAAAKLIDDIGAVSVVGAGINATYQNLLKGTAALRSAGVVPRAISTSSFRITWIVGRSDVETSVRTLHQALVGSEPQSLS
jgi:aspartate kinase